jgi:hypothetical protein
MADTTPAITEDDSDASAAATAPASPVARKKASRRTIALFSSLGVLVLVVSGAVGWWGFRAFLDGPSKQELIQSTVDLMQATLPDTIDSVTTLTAVEAEPSTIHYLYTLSAEVDPANLTESVVRESVLASLCSAAETRDLLEDEIAMRYTYTFTSTGESINMTFTQADC